MVYAVYVLHPCYINGMQVRIRTAHTIYRNLLSADQYLAVIKILYRIQFKLHGTLGGTQIQHVFIRSAFHRSGNGHCGRRIHRNRRRIVLFACKNGSMQVRIRTAVEIHCQFSSRGKNHPFACIRVVINHKLHLPFFRRQIQQIILRIAADRS